MASEHVPQTRNRPGCGICAFHPFQSVPEGISSDCRGELWEERGDRTHEGRKMKKMLVLLAIMGMALSLRAFAQNAPLPDSAGGGTSGSMQLRAPSPGDHGRKDLCCRQWKKSTCAKKEGGRCVEWNYTCASWGKPPCRTR